MLSAVAHGSGVLITTTAMPRHLTHPDVAFVPFAGMPPARVALVWRRDNDKTKVIEFAGVPADPRFPGPAASGRHPRRQPGRVEGLRREEVAHRAGASVDYYMRLEQSSATQP